MPKELRWALCFVAGLVAGGVMAFAWGWITFARGHSGIDYPELDRLTRMVCFGAAIDGATGFVLGLGLLGRGFILGWSLGLILRFSLAFLPADRLTTSQYLAAFAIAELLPIASGLVGARMAK